MRFKEFLNENATRTGAKRPLYPPEYDCHPIDDIGYVPIIHIPASADLITWMFMKLKPYRWENFEKVFGHEKVPEPSWPKINLGPDYGNR